MKALILRAALWCLLLAAPLVHAAQSAPVLLWLTSDITTAPRTAMVQRLAGEAGLGFVHIDYPLGGPAVLDLAQSQKLQKALEGAALVWVDAPHASVEARLRRMVGAQLDARAARCRGFLSLDGMHQRRSQQQAPQCHAQNQRPHGLAGSAAPAPASAGATPVSGM